MFQLAPVMISTHYSQLYESCVAERRVFPRLVAEMSDLFLEQ
jgi:hypothetical protein